MHRLTPVTHSLNTLSTEKNYWITFNSPNHLFTHTHAQPFYVVQMVRQCHFPYYISSLISEMMSLLLCVFYFIHDCLLLSNIETSDCVILSWRTTTLLFDTVNLRSNVLARFERLAFFSRNSSLLCSHSHLLKPLLGEENS